MPRNKCPTTKLDHSFLSSSLHAAEVAYVKSQHNVEDLRAQEDERRLRVLLQILENENEASKERILAEAHRAEMEAAQSIEHRADKERAESEADILKGDLTVREHECETLRRELQASQASSTDASTLLSEKLSLTRELITMKPELEHLRSQVASNSNLLSEKLSAQSELKDVRTELDDAKRYLLRMETQNEKRSRKSEEYSKQVAELKQELNDSRRLVQAATAASVNTEEVESLRADLSHERKEYRKLEDAHAKDARTWEAEKAVLEDKLSQFRNKLRSTKERLKEAETELMTARADAAVSMKVVAENAQDRKLKKSRKRNATQSFESDAAMGTPGDGEANKRSKRASSVVGEKSNFSITPFLSRRSSVQPEGAEEVLPSIEDCSPGIRPPSITEAGKTILGPAGAGKFNSKNKPKRSAVSIATLEQVAEEAESNDENAAPTETLTHSIELEKLTSSKPRKPTLKPRKSLANFASFRESSVQLELRMGSFPPMQKKKRKLLGNSGAKTLFDEEEEVERDTVGGTTGRAVGSRVGGGQRVFGTFPKAISSFGGSLVSKRKGPLQSAEGFAFSPLKKERREIAQANKAAGEAHNISQAKYG